MFETMRMIFLYVETPLHAGTGRGLGAVDLPIQRERTTGYPMVQGSSLKGCLRACFREEKCNGDDNHPELLALFGKAGSEGENWAGAIAPGDARILLFPVRSLAGVFAWVTSRDVLARFQREAALVKLALNWRGLDAEPGKEEAWVSGETLIAGGQVVLEEFSFAPKQEVLVKTIGEWLAEKALPKESEYEYWRKALPQKLCILSEDAFRDFVLYGTEVQTHVRLDPEKKTVQKGALWTAESLPVDTLLYAPVMATKTRDGSGLSAEAVLGRLADLNLTRVQLGGDETTGQGTVAVRFAGGAK
ncbi:MAG: type III-B CRISPR module RAMP protein Cmr4 [Anaerolineae bacterium]